MRPLIEVPETLLNGFLYLSLLFFIAYAIVSNGFQETLSFETRCFIAISYTALQLCFVIVYYLDKGPNPPKTK